MEFLVMKYIIYVLDRTNNRWDSREEKTSVCQHTAMKWSKNEAHDGGVGQDWTESQQTLKEKRGRKILLTLVKKKLEWLD